MSPRHYIKLLIVALIIAAAMLLEISDLGDAESMLALASGYADHWWLILVLIALQVVLFTFALAGSFFIWIVAPIYPPAMATFILVAGGTLGGITAYLFSRCLTDEWITRIEHSPVYRLLREQGNFFTLFALRVFPGFPHALVNYSSGVLKVRLGHFIAAAICGLAIKFYLYASVIHEITSTRSFNQLLDISTYGPLLLLAVIVLLGVLIRKRLGSRYKHEDHH